MDIGVGWGRGSLQFLILYLKADIVKDAAPSLTERLALLNLLK
jgi:hypothetical protein